ncbi:hypothetical protein SAMN02927924_02188 [Sphingobium faniae]|nr:hypothetical protein SAMN02927924_02188 [Sphingobium faniae]
MELDQSRMQLSKIGRSLIISLAMDSFADPPWPDQFALLMSTLSTHSG